MMTARVRELLLLVTTLVSLCSVVHSQESCERVTLDLLGDTNMLNPTGLIGESIAPGGDSNAVPPVQVMSMNIVCEAQDVVQDRYSYTSVVANFICNSSDARISYCDGSTPIIQQFDFGCIDEMWVRTIFNTVNFAQTLNPNATLTTERDSDCLLCINPTHSLATSYTVTNDTHCVKCSSCSDGLQRCYNFDNPVCCSYFYEGECTTTCPNALVGDQNFVCGCTELNDANGDFTFTNGLSVGSNATLNCEADFLLNGSSLVTCQESGWTGMPTCSPICGQHISDCIVCTLDQQNQVECSACSTGLVLINGACTEAATPPPSSCETGCIIGLAVGIPLALLLIIIVMIIIVVVLIKKCKNGKSNKVV